MTDIASLTAADLVRLYRRKELSPVEATRDVLARIERHQPAVNAFVLVDADGALAAARAAEARWHKGEARGLVDGVPATVKDNIWVRGLPSRRGSLTSDQTPQAEDAPAPARLREQGAEIWAWLERGAHFYVCGDASRMAKDVQDALLEIIVSHGGKSQEDAEEYLNELRRAKRYQRDVY